ncbi:MAG: toxic anion resistance protein, partial [Eubacterium sp.]
MSDELKMEGVETPSLTLDPFADAQSKPELTLEVPQAKAVEQVVEENPLTPEEQRMVDEFARQININDSNLVMQYGAGAQKKIADFSDTALDNVKTQDLGEVGNMLTSMVVELKKFDVDEEDKGIFGFFKKGANKIEGMKAKYAAAETNVNKICDVLEGHQIQLLKDIAMLDKMYDINLTYFKELSMYILAGKKKLEEVQT